MGKTEAVAVLAFQGSGVSRLPAPGLALAEGGTPSLAAMGRSSASWVQAACAPDVRPPGVPEDCPRVTVPAPAWAELCICSSEEGPAV